MRLRSFAVRTDSDMIITSTKNPLVIKYSKLKDEKYRTAEGLFLCEGIKLVEESVKASVAEVLLCRSDKVGDFDRLLECAKENSVEVIVFSEAPFSKISTEKSPQGIISVCSCLEVKSEADITGSAVMCCGVRDPGNLGTIIRTAAGLGFENIIMNDCADVFNPRTVRAAMGGIFRISLVEVDDPVKAAESLKRNHRRVLAASLRDDSLVLGKFDILPSDVFVIGNEGHGLDRDFIDFCDASVCIELFNGVESFNAAIAAGMILWEQSKTLN